MNLFIKRNCGAAIGGVVIILALFSSFRSAYSMAESAVANYSALVHPDSNGNLVYAKDSNGNVIPDFSYAGYMGGGVRIPDAEVKITISPDASSSDDTSRIQAAIDSVSKMPADSTGLRGSVLLLRGNYRLSKSLTIAAGGVVLRGQGDDIDGTILHATMTKPGTLIRVAGIGLREEIKGTRHNVVDAVVPVGQLLMQLDSVAGLSAGDTIVVQRDTNEKWVKANNMDDLGVRQDGGRVVNWTPGLREGYERKIASVSGNQITLNAPLTTALEAEYGGAIVFRYESPGRIHQVGVENLRAVSEYSPGPGVIPGPGEKYGINLDNPANRDRKVGTDTLDHAATFITFDNCQDVWAQDFICIDFMYSGISVAANADRVTIQDGDYQAPDPALGLYLVEPHAKAARYAYCLSGQHTLVQRCTTVHARHSFMTQSEVPGPNVFLDCDAKSQDSESQPHQRWSTGVLFDRVGKQIPTSIYLGNRKSMGTGHGWSGAYCMIWNSIGQFIVEAPPTAPNWAVGCSGTRHAGPFEPFESQVYESWGKPVEPSSLYLAQLRDRLGPGAVENLQKRPILTGMSQ